jgi:hypothetical protein
MSTSRFVTTTRVALAVSILGAWWAALSAQPVTHTPDQQRALRALVAIQRALPRGAADTEIQWLIKSVENVRNKPIPQSVFSGLEADQMALRKVRGFPAFARQQVIGVVVDDLKLKGAYCRSHEDGMAAQVLLTVKTWRQGDAASEAHQWQVMYINAPLAGPGRKGEPFPKFSSPTSITLPPGAYVVWAQDPRNEARRGPEKIVRLGAGGAPAGSSLAADLLVPGAL